MASELEIAWAAGLIDADGCVTMNSHKGTWRKPLIVVDNTDREILDRLIALFGGALVAKKRYADHHRQAWSWRLYGANNVGSFLVAILPHMHCAMKRERARMIVEELSTPYASQRRLHRRDARDEGGVRSPLHAAWSRARRSLTRSPHAIDSSPRPRCFGSTLWPTAWLRSWRSATPFARTATRSGLACAGQVDLGH